MLRMEDKTLKKKRVEMPQTSIAEEYGALESVGIPTKPSWLMGLSFPSGNTWIKQVAVIENSSWACPKSLSQQHQECFW